MKLLLATIAAIGITTLNAMSDTARIYAGHNASGSATAIAAGSSPMRVFRGHNSSGSAFCAVDFGSTIRMYRGHNASGSAAYAISGELPPAVIVFLAEKLLD